MFLFPVAAVLKLVIATVIVQFVCNLFVWQ